MTDLLDASAEATQPTHDGPSKKDWRGVAKEEAASGDCETVLEAANMVPQCEPGVCSNNV